LRLVRPIVGYLSPGGQARFWQLDLLRPPGDDLKLATDLEPVELRPAIGLGALAAGQVAHADLVGQAEQRASDALGVGIPVGAAVGQDMPDRDEQLARNRDDRFVAAKPRLQPRHFGLPVGMMAGGVVGRFHHDPAQVAATRFRNAAGAEIALFWRCKLDHELRELVERLHRVSPMPDDASPEQTVERLREYQNLLTKISDAVERQGQLTPSLISALIHSFGYGDAYGLYWATLHLLEKAPFHQLRPELHRALVTGERGARLWSAYMIGRQHDPQDVVPLISALGDADDEVRYNVVMAIKMIGDKRAKPHVEQLLNDSSPKVRKKAAEYIAEVKNN
jgi:hypothetical protein